MCFIKKSHLSEKNNLKAVIKIAEIARNPGFDPDQLIWLFIPFSISTAYVMFVLFSRVVFHNEMAEGNDQSTLDKPRTPASQTPAPQPSYTFPVADFKNTGPVKLEKDYEGPQEHALKDKSSRSIREPLVFDKELNEQAFIGTDVDIIEHVDDVTMTESKRGSCSGKTL